MSLDAAERLNRWFHYLESIGLYDDQEALENMFDSWERGDEPPSNES